MRLPFVIISSTLLVVGTAFADGHEGNMHPPMGPPEQPTVILGPPEGFEPPGDAMGDIPTDPEEAKRLALEKFFKFMDSSGNGEVNWDEFTAWVKHFAMPEIVRHEGEHMDHPLEDHDGAQMEIGAIEMEHPPEGDHGIELREGDEDLAHLPTAPECSDALRDSELGPQEEGHPCRDREGNLVFRTICNMPGFEMVAISLPAGRTASCFGIEALRGSIAFDIVAEDGSHVWDISMGPESYKGLKLDEGIYHIRAVGGEAEGALTVRFVDVSTE